MAPSAAASSPPPSRTAVTQGAHTHTATSMRADLHNYLLQQ